MTASARSSKGAHERAVLIASTAQTATSTGVESIRLPVAAAYAFILDVTAAATAVGDTLNVFVQTRIDDTGGENWLDIAHFTEVLGNGGPKQYVTKVTRGLATAEYEVGTALGAAAVRNIMGDEYRVRFAIIDADTDDASFTFGVTAIPM